MRAPQRVLYVCLIAAKIVVRTDGRFPTGYVTRVLLQFAQCLGCFCVEECPLLYPLMGYVWAHNPSLVWAHNPLSCSFCNTLLHFVKLETTLCDVIFPYIKTYISVIMMRPVDTLFMQVYIIVLYYNLMIHPHSQPCCSLY
jgi:hypothetical protein